MHDTHKVWNIVYRFNSDALELLILKPNPEPGRNTDFYVITGGIEAGEASIDTAIRETQEEIGIAPILTTDLHKTISYVDKFSKITYTEHCFAIEIDDSPIILNEEHTDYKWISLDDFVDSIWWEGDKTELMDIVKAFRAVAY